MLTKLVLFKRRVAQSFTLSETCVSLVTRDLLLVTDIINMGLDEIKKFLSHQSSFVGRCAHANSYKLINKVGKIDDEKYIRSIVTNELC